MNNKYLFIVYEMIPYTKFWGASQRVYYFSDFLHRNNQNVTVISSKNTIQKFNYNKDVEFCVLHYDNNKQIAINESLTSSNIATPKSLFRFSIFFVKTFKKLLLKIENILINEPNKGVGILSSIWFLKNINKIKLEISNKSINKVIISGPPFSLFNYLLLIKLKGNSKFKLILDYRDPWNCWNGKSGFSKFLEKRAIKFADCIITTNVNHKEKLIQDFDILQSKVKVIMNGYDLKLWNELNDYKADRFKSNDIIVSYIGSISFDEKSYRNPNILLKAIEKFKGNKTLKFRFIGLNYDEIKLKQLNEKYDNITFYGIVSQKESLKFMLDSDVLMNIHTIDDQSSKYLIGGKLFDYYKSNRFIFSINNPNSFESTFIINESLGLCVENKIDSISDGFEYILNNTQSIKQRTISFRDTTKYSRDYFNETLLEI